MTNIFFPDSIVFSPQSQALYLYEIYSAFIQVSKKQISFFKLRNFIPDLIQDEMMDVFQVEPLENRNIEIYIRNISDEKEKKKSHYYEAGESLMFEQMSMSHKMYQRSSEGESGVYYKMEDNLNEDQILEVEQLKMKNITVPVNDHFMHDEEDRKKNGLGKSISADEANLNSIKESILSLDFSWRSLQTKHDQKEDEKRQEKKQRKYTSRKNPSCTESTFRKSIDNPYGFKTLRNNFLVDVNE
jgi:hypothetical protein